MPIVNIKVMEIELGCVQFKGSDLGASLYLLKRGKFAATSSGLGFGERIRLPLISRHFDFEIITPKLIDVIKNTNKMRCLAEVKKYKHLVFSSRSQNNFL